MSLKQGNIIKFLDTILLGSNSSQKEDLRGVVSIEMKIVHKNTYALIVDAQDDFDGEKYLKLFNINEPTDIIEISTKELAGRRITLIRS